MESKLLEKLGIDPAIMLIVMFLLIVVLFIGIISVNMKYIRLKSRYTSFMRGKDGKTLEESILDSFSELDDIKNVVRKNCQDIRKINKEMLSNYQKVGILKYDAYNEMGGKLSFVITLLDGNNNGWILNSMHNRDGCYNYVKEIVNGESYIELSEEEAESLERAVYQDTMGLEIESMNKK